MKASKLFIVKQYTNNNRKNIYSVENKMSGML